MEYAAIIAFWCIVVLVLFKEPHALIYLYFASLPFGSFAVIPTSVIGGLTLTPAPVVALALIAREFVTAGGLRSAIAIALKPSGLLFIFLFWVLSVITTIFAPRFFFNTITIVPMRAEGLFNTSLLAPTTQNISQLVYISISVLAVFVFSRMLRFKQARLHALQALCVGAGVTVLTGFADAASQALSLQPALEVFRTASYALMVDDQILDSKRVVGLMPEASSFGGLALNFLSALYFFRRAMEKGRMRDFFVPIVMVLLLIIVWLSTSSSAYLGLGIFCVAAIGEWFWRLFFAKRNHYLQRSLSREFWIFGYLSGIVLLVALAKPQLFSPVLNMIDATIVQKSNSLSYEERSMWTEVSWNALLSSYGLGVGIGSTRASNFVVALSSNAGLLAATFYFIFLVQFFILRNDRNQDLNSEALLSACRWSYLPTFFAMLTIATTPDFGLFSSFLYGFAVALIHKSTSEKKLFKYIQQDLAILRRRRLRLLTHNSVHRDN